MRRCIPDNSRQVNSEGRKSFSLSMDRLYCCCWSRKASKHETNALLDGAEGGDYRPPLVTPQVPTVKHFKLLSTIGKGAFGKVSVWYATEKRRVAENRFFVSIGRDASLRGRNN